MKKIAIIGSGFAGLMTLVHLIERGEHGSEIIIFGDTKTFNKGIAYTPYSKKHLLNVITSKMSAFPDKPAHFLDWIKNRDEFTLTDPDLLSNSFLPRYLYGEYLSAIWQESVRKAEAKNILIRQIEEKVSDLEISDAKVILFYSDSSIIADYCVLASGNNLPGNPEIENEAFYSSRNYFRNPWDADSVSNLQYVKGVLIIGNGLTMVDTVIGLLEQGYRGKIFSISRNGFNIMPHRTNLPYYSGLVDELGENPSLFEIVKLINQHRKKLEAFGLSAEPVIDSLRPHTQKLWKNFSPNEKKVFMSRFRHLWGVARHRVPPAIYDKIQQLKSEGSLEIISGKILNFFEKDDKIIAEFYKRKGSIENITVRRVINCTGPETNQEKADSILLCNCLNKGIIIQDKLKLGIVADTDSFQVFNADGERHNNIFALGSLLKGELWESTAVNEIRKQASIIAEKITGI